MKANKSTVKNPRLEILTLLREADKKPAFLSGLSAIPHNRILSFLDGTALLSVDELVTCREILRKAVEQKRAEVIGSFPTIENSVSCFPDAASNKINTYPCDYYCLRCGYSWNRREKRRVDFWPKACPDCGSRKWDKK